MKSRYKVCPWKSTYYRIVERTSNPKHKRYARYGGRGIKNLITEDELKFLWKRDGASNMKFPSIDRIDNNGHYELSNCRYIEVAENSARTNNLKTHCPKGHVYKGKNLMIKNGRIRKVRACRACHNAMNRAYQLKKTVVDNAMYEVIKALDDFFNRTTTKPKTEKGWRYTEDVLREKYKRLSNLKSLQERKNCE